MAPVHSDIVYRSNRGRFLILPLMGVPLLAFPLLVLAYGGDAREAGIVLFVVMSLPGLLLLLIGAAYLRLRVTVGDEVVDVSLPRAGSTPWFPWLVRSAQIPWSAVRGIDVQSRGNPYAPGGIERLTFLRTDDGDYYLNSIWFPRFDELLAELTRRGGAEITETDLDAPPPLTATGQRPPLNGAELAARGCGWSFIVIAVLVALGAGLVAIFGEPDERSNALKALVITAVALPAARMLLRYRQPK
ncbi:MAG: hypothetical protein KDA44_03845 [Planctomycetales bacterium]|nr:hypothetical protein [Planctomycetales bacterium]